MGLLKGARDVLVLTRFDDSLFAAFAVIAAGIICHDLVGLQSEYFWAFVASCLMGMGTFAINDYYDVESDRRNKRLERPVVAGGITRQRAFKIIILVYALACLIASQLRPGAFLVFSIAAFLSVVYSSHLQRVFIIKNLVVASCIGAVFIFGALLSDDVIEPIAIWAALIAFTVAFGLEVMIDMADVEGDAHKRVKTIANRYSKRAAMRVSLAFFALTSALAPLPFLSPIDESLQGDKLFLALSAVSICLYALVSRSLIRDSSQANVLRLRERTLDAMRFTTGIYVIGALV